jgi:hypothetical protein
LLVFASPLTTRQPAGRPRRVYRAGGGFLGQRPVDEVPVPGVVAAQRLDEQLLLVAEGVVQAGRADAELGGQIAHRGRLVAAAPEQPDRLVQRGVPVERARSPACCCRHAHIL